MSDLRDEEPERRRKKIPFTKSMAALVEDHKIAFRHVTEGNDDLYKMTVEGMTIDGVVYDIEWFVDMNEYADLLYDIYDPEQDAEAYGNEPPEDDTERLQWFRAEFYGKEDRVRGTIVFEFPQGLSEVNFVRNRVKDILTYFTIKFVEYLATAGAKISTGGRNDLWYVEVQVRPFGMSITADATDGKSFIKRVYEQMEKQHGRKTNKEATPREDKNR